MRGRSSNTTKSQIRERHRQKISRFNADARRERFRFAWSILHRLLSADGRTLSSTDVAAIVYPDGASRRLGLESRRVGRTRAVGHASSAPATAVRLNSPDPQRGARAAIVG